MRSGIGARSSILQELIGVWRDTRLIVLTAQIAAVYAAVLIPFKAGIPLIPGFSELRPANAIPVVASLLFGPAAAWGSAFGNVIGDFFGTLGPGSLFGFIGNFFYGYVPHLLWGRMGPLSSGAEPGDRSWRQSAEFVLVCLAASGTIALIIGWGVDLFGLLPFRILAPAIFLNNFLMAVLLAPPLLFFLYPRAKRWGLRYEDLMRSARFQHPAAEDLSSHDADGPTGTDMVIVEDARFTYASTQDRRPALDGISCTIRRGEFVAIMGRSGSGKSSLCYSLNGLIPNLLSGDWSGQVCVNAATTTSMPVWRLADTVGLVFQDFETQLISTDVRMELAYPLEHLTERIAPTEMRDRMEHVLQQVGLSGLEHRDPLSLSGGQRQRLVIASILVRHPALLVLDEPTTDLDPGGRHALAGILKGLHRSGVTVVLVTQDPDEAISADRLFVLQNGRLVWDGPPATFFRQSGSAVQYGVRPLPLADCFAGLDLPSVPVTVEDAWKLADEHQLSLDPPGDILTGESRTASSPRAAQLSPTVHVDNVSHEYVPGQKVLSNISLTIRRQEFLAIVGQNGSGKTTLAQMLNGLLTPLEGRILVDDTDLRTVNVGHLASTVGYVFQNPDHQIFAETVGEEVAFGPRNLGWPPDDCRRRVAEALEAVGLDRPGIEAADPFSMTKGERQRVAVASVLAARPPVLIFDEPTTGLDAEETDRMMGMIQDLNHQGHTIIIITHSLALVARYARRCVLLQRGRILADGTTRDVFSNPEALKEAALPLPTVTRFAQRWGHTLLTVEEVRASLRTKPS